MASSCNQLVSIIEGEPGKMPYIRVSTHAGIFKTPVGYLLADEIRVKDHACFSTLKDTFST